MSGRVQWANFSYRERLMAASERVPESYEKIVIVGVGLIGGSLAMAFRQANYAGKLVGVSSEGAIEEALRLGIVDEGFPYDRLHDAVDGADLVVLGSPIAVIIEQLKTLGGFGAHLKRGLVVTDVGSTKRSVLEAAEESLPDHVHFIGGHPLAGSEQRGVAAAEPFLFQNAFYVLTPGAKTPEEEVRRLGRLVELTGARVLVLGAEEHDRIAATISHVPQLLAVSLVLFLESLGSETEHGKHLAAGGFRDMTRIASSPYSVWRDIITTNRDIIDELLHKFLDHIRFTLDNLGDETLAKVFKSSAEIRGEIPRDTKGFLSRLWDVLVVVEDQPGVIVGVCAPLGEKGMNVQDIEVVKVREGDGGTLRLSFRTRDLAERAVAELVARGYTARLRE